MSDSALTDISGWLTLAAAGATTIGAVIAYSSARSASQQAKAAVDTLHESSKQSTLIKAQLTEMRLQNNISLHAHQLEVYRVFTDLRFELKARSGDFDRKKLSAYYAQVQLAEFYFSPRISTALSSTIEKIIRLKHLADNVSDHQGADREELKATTSSRNALYNEIDTIFDTLDVDIKSVLRLQPPAV